MKMYKTSILGLNLKVDMGVIEIFQLWYLIVAKSTPVVSPLLLPVT